MGAKSQADESSGPAEPSHPHRKAEDMTAPETFTVPSKRPLTTGRRLTGIRPFESYVKDTKRQNVNR